MIACAIMIQDLHWLGTAVPRGEMLLQEFGESGRVGSQGDGFGGPDAGNLVVAVARVNAAPAVDDDVGAEFADDTDHILEDLIAPDLFGFFGSFGIAKIAGAREVELHAIAARGGQQFLCANEAELRGLFGAESVLAAFAASQGEQGHIGVEAASEIGEDGSAFIVGMRGDVEDARGDAGAVNGLDGFRETWAGPRRRRKLGRGGRKVEQPKQEKKS